MAVTMTPQHLLALVLITISHVKSALLISIAPHNFRAPDFWWDLSLNRTALISFMIFPPLTSDIIDSHSEDLETQKYDWDLKFAHGTSMQWLAGGHGFWSLWKWKSSQNKDITGGGFIYNETALGIVGGVNWLHDGHNDAITWNCFVEGNIDGSLPWSNWKIKLEDGAKIGFEQEQWKWGFIVDDNTVISKHCAAGNPVIGKRYRFQNRREVASSVNVDPFKNVKRHKRSPGFFEKVSETFKKWMQKIKNFFTGDQQNEADGENNPEGREGGQKCNTIWDVMVRIMDLILGRRKPGETTEGPPSMPEPPGGIPQGPNGEIPEPDEGGGDPPGGAVVPPADAEELDPSQNDAVRDWE